MSTVLRTPFSFLAAIIAVSWFSTGLAACGSSTTSGAGGSSTSASSSSSGGGGASTTGSGEVLQRSNRVRQRNHNRRQPERSGATCRTIGT